MHDPARQRKQIVAPLAAVIAALYFALVCFAASCSFIHIDSSKGHDHHQQDSGHSSLCGWSCQATSSVALTSEPPVAIAWHVERTAVLVSPVPVSDQTVERLRARAPPFLQFV